MNKVEAKWILLRELAQWRRRSYEELVPLIGDPQCFEKDANSGIVYQLEVEPIWDDKPNGSVRVVGSIDDGGVRTCCPVSYGVIIDKPPAA